MLLSLKDSANYFVSQGTGVYWVRCGDHGGILAGDRVDEPVEAAVVPALCTALF